MSYTKESVNNLAQQYFQEYQRRCAENPNAMLEESAFWTSGDGFVLDMSLEEQAEYADYVVTKICELGHEAAEQMAELSFENTSENIDAYANGQNICAVGNYAKIILTIEDSLLKEKHLEHHKKMIEYAKSHQVPNACVLH